MTLSAVEFRVALPGLQWVGKELSEKRYRIKKLLSESNLGPVFQGVDTVARREVVVKLAAPRWLDGEASVQRVAQELHWLQEIEHPRLVSVIDSGVHDGIPFAIVPHLAGGSLWERMLSGEEVEPQPVASLKSWVGPVAEALDFLHSKGILHRDIRPVSILFDANGNAKLSDVALTRGLTVVAPMTSPDDPLPPELLGSAGYLAPELLAEQPADGRADQYGLALTVYEALAAENPLDGLAPPAVLAMQMLGQIPPLHEIQAGIAPAISAVLQRALSCDPAQRFGNCATFAKTLLQAVAVAPKGASPQRARSAAKPQSSPEVALEPDKIRLRCPGCSRLLRISAKMQGKTISCPGCKLAVKLSADNSRLERAKAAVARGPDPLPCPACRQPLLLNPDQAGTQVYCAACMTLLMVTPQFRLVLAPSSK